MFYTENLPNLNKTSLRVKLSDFSKGINTTVTENILPLNYAVNTYNFDFNSGALTEGLGLKELEIKNESTTKVMNTPENVTEIKNFWHFRRYDTSMKKFSPFMMIYCDDGKVYSGRLATLDTNFYDVGIAFDTEPIGINYRLNDKDTFLCCAPNKIITYNGNTNPATYTENVPDITSVALHAGRLFATTGGDQSQLWFSDDLDPTNWNVSEFEGGYIELTDDRGTLKKVIESNNYLYVIREYGITRVSGWGLQDEFTVKNLYLTTGKLYYKSAVLCGGAILMLCRDGIYYFTGSSMQKLDLGLDKYFENVDNDYAIGAFLDGKYYLACRLNFNDSALIGCENSAYQNNTLIEYDLDNGNVNILRGVDICSITPFQTEWFSKLVICRNDENKNKLYELTHDGLVCNTPTNKTWTSAYTDMGYPSYKKAIKNLFLTTKYDIEILFNADGKDYTFNVKGSDYPTKIPINLMAKRFSVTFLTNNQYSEISNPELEVALC